MEKKGPAPVPDTDFLLPCFGVKPEAQVPAESTTEISDSSSLSFNKPASRPLKHFVFILHLIAFG